MKTIQQIPLILMILLTSCTSQDTRSELTDKWIDAERENQIIELEKFGNDLSLLINGKSYAVTIRDKTHFVNFGGNEIPILYDKQTDQILYEGLKFKRFKNSQKENLIGRWSLDENFDDATPAAASKKSKEIRIDTENGKYYLYDYFRNRVEVKYEKPSDLYPDASGLSVQENPRYPTEGFQFEELKGKDYLIIEGGMEGDFWKYYYTKM
ncbi:MAG: hypothetical protein WBA61_05005 [Aequorivita sp.]